MGKISLELPLPPSVNAAFMNNRYGRRFNRPETVEWYNSVIPIINRFKIKTRTYDEWVYCDMEFWLRRKGSDAHNYLKIFNDGLEKAGLVSNDSLILNRIQSIEFDPKNPRIIATFTPRLSS